MTQVPMEDIYTYAVDNPKLRDTFDSTGDTFVAVDNHDGWVIIYRNGEEVGRRFLAPIAIR